jgi:hypothetical protein
VHYHPRSDRDDASTGINPTGIFGQIFGFLFLVACVFAPVWGWIVLFAWGTNAIGKARDWRRSKKANAIFAAEFDRKEAEARIAEAKAAEQKKRQDKIREDRLFIKNYVRPETDDFYKPFPGERQSAVK